MKPGKTAALFGIGGSGYLGLELLWRGRTHGSMFFAGGLCFLLMGRLRRLPPLSRGIAGAAGITAVELLFGLTVNREYRVWDYRSLPGNYRGRSVPSTRPSGCRFHWQPVRCTGRWTGIF